MASLIGSVWRQGARNFVCNAPGQRAYFPDSLPADVRLVSGPFCNIANALAVQELAELGYGAAIISPELPREDILALPRRCPLPLGLVLEGFWPVGMSRFGLMGINSGEGFTSPKRETFWTRDRGGLTWIFPSWPLDLQEKRQELAAVGYSFFVFLEESAPRDLAMKKRPGNFNWEGQLL